MKTVTGAAAFHYLGEDYRYTTSLQYSGSINASGFLDGYIYVVGKRWFRPIVDHVDRTHLSGYE